MKIWSLVTPVIFLAGCETYTPFVDVPVPTSLLMSACYEASDAPPYLALPGLVFDGAQPIARLGDGTILGFRCRWYDVAAKRDYEARVYIGDPDLRLRGQHVRQYLFAHGFTPED